MNTFRVSLVVLAFWTCHATAQPKTGQVQPDHIAVGTVYTGAIVEASFQVYEAGKDANIQILVNAPDFVKVRKAKTHGQNFGPGNDFVCGSVEIAFDTTSPGELKGDIGVTLGRTRVRVPVGATVRASRPAQTRLLIAATPFEKYATDDGKMFRAWTDLVKDSPLDPSYLLVDRDKPVLRDLDLGKFDCVFLPAEALRRASATDVKRVREYAENGGRVVVAANYFFRGTVVKANAVLDGYGLTMRDTEARGPNAQRNGVIVDRKELDPALVKAGIGSAHFFRASPVAVTDATKARVLVPAKGVGEPGDGFVATARAGHGEVIAIGQSLWCFWISKEQAKGADNAKLLRWLLVPTERP